MPGWRWQGRQTQLLLLLPLDDDDSSLTPEEEDAQEGASAMQRAVRSRLKPCGSLLQRIAAQYEIGSDGPAYRATVSPASASGVAV